MSFRQWWLFISALVAVASLASASCYAYLAGREHLLSHDSQHLVRNYFANVWFCCLLAFLCIQNIIIQSQVY